MAEYQLTATDSVIRTEDGACIPNDPANRDRIEYDEWITAGGVPDPHVPPPVVPPQASPEAQIFFDHENRLLAIEGHPPMTIQDVLNKLRGGRPA